MKIQPKIDLNSFEAAFRVIDTHTAGEFTRIIVSGFPALEGKTMIERKNFLAENYDQYRQALMFEPRGHHDMFGALLTEPVNPEADYGVIFMDTGKYLNMCGHGTIGAVTALIETGLVPAAEPYTEVVLDAPAGLIRTRAEVKNGQVKNVTLTNVPSFLYKENLTTVIDGKEIHYDISFGGSFFAMVDADQLGMDVNRLTIPKLTEFAMKMIHQVNDEIQIRHPELDITSLDLVDLYCPTETPGCDKRNVLIWGDHMADRSPGGTATSAMLAALHARNKIQIGEPFVFESFIGSQFRGQILETTKVGEFDAVVSQFTGSAYVTGQATYVIDPDDPLKYGFKVGRSQMLAD